MWLPFTVEVVSADGSPEAAHLQWGPTYLEDGMVMGPGLEDLDPVVTETFTAHSGVLVYIDEETQRVETLRRWEPGAEGPVDLIRTDGPIMDHDLDPTHRHLALAVVGSEGATNWWVYQEQVVRLPGSATALGWSGAHWLEWDD
ncbi:MAG: hypothetical protein GY745_03435 [Actinomycetia bacterium]|nr:hypothetical protein [Actinomycetes bacterium]MCP4084100.1 hypothetical protein [Actinomycetes bacterium]